MISKNSTLLMFHFINSLAFLISKGNSVPGILYPMKDMVRMTSSTIPPRNASSWRGEIGLLSHFSSLSLDFPISPSVLKLWA
jgi:hypothetical protein